MPVFRCTPCKQRINTAQPMARNCPKCGRSMAGFPDNSPFANEVR